MSKSKINCLRCKSVNVNLYDDGTYECINCGKKFRNHDEHSRFLQASLPKTYEYFRDIKSYDKKYSRYCQRIDIVQESSEEMKTKEFWNLSIDRSTDHVTLEVCYTFFPMEKICYESIGDYAQGLKNCLYFEGEENQRTTIMAGNMLPLDIVSLPPASKKSERYVEMLHYFKQQDRIYLENKQIGHIVGQLCGRCKKGHLRLSGQKETTRRDTPECIVKTTNVTIEAFLCDYCGSRFENTVIDMR